MQQFEWDVNLREFKGGPAKKSTENFEIRAPRGRKSNRPLTLTDSAADIDRLIFKVMGIGDLPQIEEFLGQTRRRLYVRGNGR